jgi:hypothetical protein
MILGCGPEILFCGGTIFQSGPMIFLDRRGLAMLLRWHIYGPNHVYVDLQSAGANTDSEEKEKSDKRKIRRLA